MFEDLLNVSSTKNLEFLSCLSCYHLKSARKDGNLTLKREVAICMLALLFIIMTYMLKNFVLEPDKKAHHQAFALFL